MRAILCLLTSTRSLPWVALLSIIHLLVFATKSSATSVNLVITGSSGSVISSTASAITISPSGMATITVDVQLDLDSRGSSAVFLSLLFDVDGGNELNVLSFAEAWEWTKMPRCKTQCPTTGIGFSQESQDGLEGQLFTFESASTGYGPSSTTLTFARIVFETNHNKNLNDGHDIFSGMFGPQDFFGDASTPIALNIASSVSFGAISINGIPEPGTIALLGLGLGAIALAGRRSS